MDLLERGAVPEPVLSGEDVPVPSLGGAVRVVGRMLADTLQLHAFQTAALVPLEGESAADAEVRAGADIVAYTLARQVVLADGKPMWSAQQWLVHGGKEPNEALTLHAVAQRLAGAAGTGPSEDVAKN